MVHPRGKNDIANRDLQMLAKDYLGKIIMSSSLAKSEPFLRIITNQICRTFKSKTRV
jgi:hypothetical protein